MFPKRPLQHVTDDKAVNLFRCAITELGWIFREQNKDYGIDAEVEIVDTTHQVTGGLLRFQIKGRKSEVSPIRVNISSLKYWLVSPIPIFVVKVVMHTNKFFILDVQDYVENVRKGGYRLAKSKTLSLDFKHALHNDEWKEYLVEVANSHQNAVLDIRNYTLYNPVLEFISCNRLFRQHGGDIHQMIRWYREEAQDQQLMYEFGHAVYLKDRIQNEPGFLSALRDYVYAEDPENAPHE